MKMGQIREWFKKNLEFLHYFLVEMGQTHVKMRNQTLDLSLSSNPIFLILLSLSSNPIFSITVEHTINP